MIETATEPTRFFRLKVLFCSFFRISMVAVGGGLTMLPLIEAEFVEKRKWMTHEEMVDIVAVVQSMPGIIGCNMSVAIGKSIGGIPGMFAATLGMAMPPFVVIVLIAMCFLNYSDAIWLNDAFLGVRAAICALFVLAALKLGKSVLKAPFPIVLFVLAFLILVLFPQLNAVWVILGGAAAGVIKHFCFPAKGEKK